jgi:hypothetical protein
MDVNVPELFDFTANALPTRSNGAKITKPSFNLDYRASFFSDRVIEVWNKLSHNVIFSKNLNEFSMHLNRPENLQYLL